VVAFGTSAPELAVSLGATFTAQPAIAVGNVVGSNIFNVLLILGLSALIAPLVVERHLVRLDVPVMVVVSVLMLVLCLDGRLGRFDGTLLFAALIGYVVFLIRQGRSEAVAAIGDVAELRTGSASARGLITSAATALAGLGLLVFGSRMFVHGAVDLARTLGVSEVVIGLTVIAAGTSLPELATSVLASIRGERDIAVGNVVGSNIFNILAILGLCGVLGPDGVAIDRSFVVFDIPIMVAVALATLPIFFTGLRITRGEGLLFLSYYVAYTL
jgi:cation:H+ antiporter